MQRLLAAKHPSAVVNYRSRVTNFSAYGARSKHSKPYQIEVPVLTFLLCVVSEKASNVRVFAMH